MYRKKNKMKEEELSKANDIFHQRDRLHLMYMRSKIVKKKSYLRQAKKNLENK